MLLPFLAVPAYAAYACSMASPLLLGALVLSETPLRLGGDVSVVDYTSGGAPGDFAQSLKATGFAVLTNHPIKYSLIEQVYDEWREFLTSGLADQAKYERSMETQDGYFSMARAESAKGQTLQDLKQYYQLYFPRGRYPEEVSDRARVLFHQMLELGRELLQWIDEHMDAATREQLRTNNVTRLAETLDPTNTMMRILRYPPYDPELAAPGATRASAHEDINLITLLPSGSARGLELRDHRRARASSRPSSWRPVQEKLFACPVGRASGARCPSCRRRSSSTSATCSSRCPTASTAQPHTALLCPRTRT